MKKFKEVRKLAKQAFKDASKTLGIPASAIKSKDFWIHAEGKLTEWDVRRFGGVSALKQNLYPYKAGSDVISAYLSKVETSKERALETVVAQNAAFFNAFEKYSKELFKNKLVPPKFNKKLLGDPREKIERVVTTLWSDHHYGSDVSKKETGSLNFGKVEEARRLAHLVDQIATFKPQYRPQTSLKIVLNGDLIQNQLHDPRDGAPLAEQAARGIYLLSQAIRHLSGCYKLVEVDCTSGNHGRNTGRHKERALHQKWDSIETIIYYSLKMICQHLPNVRFSIPLTPFADSRVFDHRCLFTHGDTVIKPGNPAKSINVEGIETQINRINASLKDANEYKVIGLGHVHTASMIVLPNGTVVLTNSALVPVDEFAVSCGIMETSCSQWVWEATKKYPIGDSRLIQVGPEQDKDKALEKIIQPWKEF